MELNLDLSLSSVSRTISELLGESKDGSQKIAKLENFFKTLEDEKKKIEAFKRELPLSMILLNDAIARLKEELNGCIRMQEEPVVQELMPLKANLERKVPLTLGKENSDKKNWLSSVQLWKVETKSRSEEDDHSVPSNPIQPRKDGKEVSHVPSLSLMTPTFELKHRNSRSRCDDGSYGSSSVTKTVEIKDQLQLQPNSKKQRRCWSPELHRRFVDALQRLGGPQVATPKQIRERMQVGGLTNDEVKSHLQKYRLHCKRLPLSSVGKSNSVLWMSQNQSEEYHKSKGSNSSQSGSPQGPLFLRGSVKGVSSSGRNSLDTEEDVQSDCHNQITRS